MDNDQNDPHAPPGLQLDYGRVGPMFRGSSPAAGWFSLGVLLSVIPVLLVGLELADIVTDIMADHAGYRPPHYVNVYAVAFFAFLVAFAIIGILRFRKSPPPVRYVLLGIMAGAGTLGLLEGLCFGMR